MPGCMKAPWNSTKSEIRITDLAAKDIEEFKAYLAKYTGPTKRFLDVSVYDSSAVKISNRSHADLMRYVLNYIQHDGTVRPSVRSSARLPGRDLRVVGVLCC